MIRKPITPEEAADKLRALGMRISPATVREGMAQKIFPFGDYIKTNTSCVCYVYPSLLEQWIRERFGDDEGVDKP